MASKQEIRVLLEELMANYPFSKIDLAIATNLWYKNFQHIPAAQLTVACTVHMSESEFFPSVASIFKRFDQDQDPDVAWWDAVHYSAQMKSFHGVTAGLAIAPTSDPEPIPPSPLVAEVMEQIKWSDIAYADERSLTFIRKDFIKIFEHCVERANLRRRGAIIQGDRRALAEIAGPTPDVEERRRQILAQGAPKAITAGTEASSDLSEDSELSPEEELDILDGRVIVSAEDIF